VGDGVVGKEIGRPRLVVIEVHTQGLVFHHQSNVFGGSKPRPP
jgi:hypothetical protein